MISLKVVSVNISTWLGSSSFLLGLAPVLSVMKLARLSKSRPPSYSVGSSLLPSNHLSVGKPWMPKRLPRDFSASASTLAIWTVSDLVAKASANSS